MCIHRSLLGNRCNFLGTAFCPWSMSTAANGVYAMIKERCVAVPIDFHNKDLTLEPFMAFHKSLAVSCLYKKIVEKKKLTH